MKKEQGNEHRLDAVVIILNGIKINPPAGYSYGDKHKNRLLPKDSSHFWTNGSYIYWRPSNKARVYFR